MTELEVTLTSDSDCDSMLSAVDVGLEAKVVPLCVLFHFIDDLQGAVPDEAQPLNVQNVYAFLYVKGRVKLKGMAAVVFTFNFHLLDTLQ